MPFLRISTAEDVGYLAPRLRQADVDELRAGSATSPHDALTEGLLHSDPCWTACTDDGTPVVMFGVVPVEPNVGSVWMLSSDVIYDYQFSFFKISKRMLDRFNKKWRVMFNACDERNTDHIEWMRRLGYTFIARHPEFGVEKRPFIEFVRVNFNV